MDVQTVEKVCGILGFGPVGTETGCHLLERIRRIFDRSNRMPEHPDFEDSIRMAEQTVNEEGDRALWQAFAQCCAPEPAKEYKIKRSEKGTRIETVSESGVRFAFGPKWCKSVQDIKGVALIPANREKLNMHGTHLGVASPEKLTSHQLCVAISAKM